MRDQGLVQAVAKGPAVSDVPDTGIGWIGWVAVASDFASIVAGLATLVATALALYIFFRKRKELAQFLGAITSFALQDSLRELRVKLDAIDEIDVTIDLDKAIVRLHGICGQLEGNPLLKTKFVDHVAEVRKATRSRRPLTEHRKAELVSRIRETLKYISAETSANGNGD